MRSATFAFLPIPQRQLQFSWNHNSFYVRWYGIPVFSHSATEKMSAFFQRAGFDC
jgi:hypothetical protein